MKSSYFNDGGKLYRPSPSVRIPCLIFSRCQVLFYFWNILTRMLVFFLERRRRQTKWFLLKNFYFILFFLYDLAILVWEIKKMCFRNFLTFSLFPKQVSPDLGKKTNKKLLENKGSVCLSLCSKKQQLSC